MSTKTTNGIRVEVKARYVEEKSAPTKNEYLFAYEITITNENPEVVQLIHRHWIITDALGRVEEVKGPGVVGHQPRLKEGMSFRYESFCPLPTPFGSMKGNYKLLRDNGDIFTADIPLFSLVQKA